MAGTGVEYYGNYRVLRGIRTVKTTLSKSGKMPRLISKEVMLKLLV